MSLVRGIQLGVLFLLPMLVAAGIMAPRLQDELTTAGTRVLAQGGAELAGVRVSFRGRHAVLTGIVRRERDRAQAEELIRSQVRTAIAPFGWDAPFNPVAGVTNKIDLRPMPPGWLLFVNHSRHAIFKGIAASEFEARDIAGLLARRWTAAGGSAETNIGYDVDRFDESAAGEATVATAPLPPPARPILAQMYLAQLGGEWSEVYLDLGESEAAEQGLRLGLSEGEVNRILLPAMATARSFQRLALAREEEQRRQEGLAPPHLFVAARDQRFLIVGELPSMGAKRQLLNAIIAEFPSRRVIDDVRVNPNRREDVEFGPITAALLPGAGSARGGKALHFGLPGQGWQSLDPEVARDAKPWVHLLPKDLPENLVAPDSVVALEWLQGDLQGIPRLPIRAQPSFLALTLFSDRAILSGQLAEEPLRSQLIQAAHQKYGRKVVVQAEGLLARGTCEPSANVIQTARSLPRLPSRAGEVTVAFALPGQVWRSMPLTREMLAPGRLAASGLLPEDFPLAMAEDTFAEAFERAEQLWKTSTAKVGRAAATP